MYEFCHLSLCQQHRFVLNSYPGSGAKVQSRATLLWGLTPEGATLLWRLPPVCTALSDSRLGSLAYCCWFWLFIRFLANCLEVY